MGPTGLDGLKDVMSKRAVFDPGDVKQGSANNWHKRTPSRVSDRPAEYFPGEKVGTLMHGERWRWFLLRKKQVVEAGRPALEAHP